MKKLSIILITLLLFSFTSHKYYLALTEIEHNTNTESIELTMTVFIDDIETTINNDYNIDAQLWSDKEIENADKYFKEYLYSHFKIKINNANKKFNYIGKEYNGDTVYFYLEIEHIKSVSSIEIQNDMLLKYFPQQQNLIKAKVNNVRKSLFLSQKDNSGLLKF